MIRAMASNDIGSRDTGSRDSAFLWETEALRSAKPRSAQAVPDRPRKETSSGDWLTLREASAATGIPIPTLRKWARRDNVDSYLEETPVGQLRMLSMSGVLERAKELGRAVEPLDISPAVKPVNTSAPSPVAPPIPVIEPEPDEATSETPTPEVEEPESGQPEPPTVPAPAVPEGTMLVPIDAWDKMLLQLGNLHQAGQQLAEARERAAKAETESKFLKERLTELRSELAETRAAPHQPTPGPPPAKTPIDHIPIEGAEGEEDTESEDDRDIPVRDLGVTDSDSKPKERETSSEDEASSMTLTGYSLKMVNHLYSTWRGRPRR